MSTTKKKVGRPKLAEQMRKSRQIKFYAPNSYSRKLDAMSKHTGKSKGEILRELLIDAKY